MSFQGDSGAPGDKVNSPHETSATEMLSTDAQTEPPASTSGGRGRRFWFAVGAGVAIVTAAGVGFAAGAFLGGGGAQPEDVLPSTVVAYADLDLDPAASQKLNLVRLLGRFPDVEDEYGSEPDIRQVLVEQLTDGSDLASDDVESWVGDRVGIGVAWDEDAGALTPVAAIQVTDQDAAVSDLRTVLDDDQVAAADGYVIVTADIAEFDDAELTGRGGDNPLTSQTAAELVAAGEQSSLAESSAFSDAFDRLDEGLASFYLDGEGVAAAGEHVVSLLGIDDPAVSDPLAQAAESGQTAAVLRAEPDAIELEGWSTAEPPTGTAPVSMIGALPESTLFAMEFTGGREEVAEQWDKAVTSGEGDLPPGEVERSLAQVEAQFGVQLPDDLETLFGDDVVVAVDGEGLLSGVPGIGIRSVTDPEKGADLADRLGRTLAYWSGGFGITAEETDDGLVIASTPEFAEQLKQGDGGLGEAPGFQAAVPDAEGASYVVWLDLAAISGALALAEPDAANLIEPLDALGFTMTPSDDGTAVRARLVFDGS